MEELLLNLQPREITGKAVKQLRKDKMIPAVIHDHGKPSIVVMGPYIEMTKLYQKAGKRHPVTVVSDGKRHTAIIKQVDFDPKKQQLRHVVFNSIKANEKVSTEVPARIKYAEGDESTPAERAGLVVLHQLEEVEIEALPAHLPDALYFDAEKLVAAGDSVTVADLIIPQGVTVKTDPAHPLATVFEPSALQAANDAAGGDAEEEVPAEEAAEGENAAEGTETQPEDKKE